MICGCNQFCSDGVFVYVKDTKVTRSFEIGKRRKLNYCSIDIAIDIKIHSKISRNFCQITYVSMVHREK